MRALNKVAVLSLSVLLSACSSNIFHGSSGEAPQVSTSGEQSLGAGTSKGVAVGGSVGQSMDSFDHVKLSHALDKAPGTPTTWTNELTATTYTVTPIKKLTINGNSFCRQYQVVSSKGDNKHDKTGTACVASDGSWSEQ